MTLTQIRTNALRELRRGTDAQSQAQWKDVITARANEAIRDLARSLNLRKTVRITPIAGQIAIKSLPGQCIQVLSLTQSGTSVPIVYTGAALAVDADTETEVTYIYSPAELSSDTDEPEFPEHLHELIVLYVIFREHETADPTMQRRGNVYYELYEQGKKRARNSMRDSASYQFENTMSGW